MNPLQEGTLQMNGPQPKTGLLTEKNPLSSSLSFLTPITQGVVKTIQNQTREAPLATSILGPVSKPQIPGLGGGAVPTSPELPGLGGGTVKATPSGGVSFNPEVVNPTQTPQAPSQNLSDYIIKNGTTPNGGTYNYSNVNGVTQYNPSVGLTLPKGNSVPSSALQGADVNGQYNQYQDLVNALAQAQGYSPAYLQALGQQYGAQAQGAYLGSKGAGIAANVATGNGYTGYSTQQAATEGGIQQALNAQQEALNTQKQTEANIALNTQQLARTGNIAAAQTELASSPVGMSGQNAINQYNSLQTLYPGANIPSYNPSLTPEENQQIANQAVASSPSYQAQFLGSYQTPGGGTGLYSKLDTGALQTNPNGTLSLVSGAAASLGSAEANSLNTQIQSYNALAVPYQAANADFSAMQSFIQQAGLNQSNIPIINQVQNAVKARTLDPGAVAAMQTYIQSLRANYTQLLGARGETPTNAGAAANALVPDNLNPSQLAEVQQALNTNGGNILSATGQQIAAITSQLPGGAQPAAVQNTTQVTNGQNPFSAQAFFGQ